LRLNDAKERVLSESALKLLDLRQTGRVVPLNGSWEGTMKLPRRRFLHLAAGAAALPALPNVARAQAYPTRPVRIIVPAAAGGTSDILTRLIGRWLSERFGKPFIVENRPGAGTNIGTEAVVKAPPDGYTLLTITPPNAIALR
jgi:tripartite-type tricarboxylate transporter receptor subunit TctC